MNKHYRVLFLAMSCNDPFFEMSRRVVHDTWAKDILEGKFPEIGFFSYTSTDKEDYIEDNCVYVREQDDINHTYSKTIKAMSFLREQGITWDVVVRTNTSTFINVENTLKLVEQYGNGMVSFSIVDWECEGVKVPLPAGWYMILPGALTEKLIDCKDRLNEDVDVHNIKDLNTFLGNRTDDMLLGVFRHVVNQQLNLNIPFYYLDRMTFVQHYKSFINNPYIQDPRERVGIYGYNQNDDPNRIHSCIAMQVRLPGVKSMYRYIELERMYELYEAIKKRSN